MENFCHVKKLKLVSMGKKLIAAFSAAVYTTRRVCKAVKKASAVDVHALYNHVTRYLGHDHKKSLYIAGKWAHCSTLNDFCFEWRFLTASI